MFKDTPCKLSYFFQQWSYITQPPEPPPSGLGLEQLVGLSALPAFDIRFFLLFYLSLRGPSEPAFFLTASLYQAGKAAKVRYFIPFLDIRVQGAMEMNKNREIDKMLSVATPGYHSKMP